MKALVTGGNGFVGRRIVEMLRERGTEVRVLGRHPYPELQALGVECHLGDVRNREQIMPAFDGVDTVFHVAAKVGLWGNPKDFESINVQGTKNVISCCQEKGVRRLVFTSSPSVVFNSEPLRNADETLPYPKKFLSEYPKTKAEAERLVIAANNVHGLSTCALRPHLVWGPGDTHLVPGILERARQGKLVIVGDGENIVDFTYVDNVAEAHVLAATHLSADSPVAGQCYFISQDEPIKFWEFVKELVTRAGYEAPRKRISLRFAKLIGHCAELAFRFLPLSGEPRLTPFLAEQLAMSHHFSIEKAKKDFGYQPRVTMEMGLKRTLQSLSN